MTKQNSSNDGSQNFTSIPEQFGGGDADVISQLEKRLSTTGETVKEPKVKDPDPNDDDQNDDDQNDDDQNDDDQNDDDQNDDDQNDDDDDAIQLTEEQLSAALGLPEGSAKVDDEGNVLLRTKVDGKVSFIEADKLIASHQMEAHLQGKIRDAAEDRKVFETEKETESTKLQTSIMETASLLQVVENQMFVGYQGMDLNALKISDPGKWAAISQEIRQKQEHMQQMKGNLGAIITKQQKDFKDKAEAEQTIRLNKQADDLVTAIPTWSDPEVAAKEIQELMPSAKALGYTEEEFADLNDHRVILAIRGYAKAEVVKDKKKTIKKRLKNVPKIIKVGGRSNSSNDPKTKDQRRRKQLSDNVKASGGDIKSVAEALIDRV